ncbi:hypothetical protein Tcan_05740 [Toxocara canis]|uniref:G protein-coupled receptor n=1 Tax=Toxocara canis TaxID=6265 RepID=A0A0B2W3W0_TOXCA|nr:hypothetical protein Tcan_05740 [Toxocara canis]
MVLQAVFPVIFTILPIVLFYAVAITHLNSMEYGSIVMIFFNCQTVINPFLTIYFIRPFRNRVLHAFRFRSTPHSLFTKTIITNNGIV